MNGRQLWEERNYAKEGKGDQEERKEADTYGPGRDREKRAELPILIRKMFSVDV